jgi:hypothetical protein
MAIRSNARIRQLELTLAEANRRRRMRSQRRQFRALVDSLPAMSNSSDGWEAVATTGDITTCYVILKRPKSK